MAAWAVVPLADGWVVADINVGILYLFAISSLGVYGIIMGGWASNSKYAFLGSLRSAAQMVSYEVSIGFILITVLLYAGSLNLSDIVRAQAHGWFVFSHPVPDVRAVLHLGAGRNQPAALRFAGSGIGTGRGLHGGYSSTPYLLFQIGEYFNIVLMCALGSILFFGGWLPPIDVWPLNAVPGVIWLIVKVWVFFFMFAMVKAIVPRYRYDQLMRLGWKVFLPLSLVWVAADRGYLLYIEQAPGVM